MKKFASLPAPDSFKTLMEEIPHYGSDYWHGIFADKTFCEIATDLTQGSSLVTDLDYTAYHHDAGFTLLEAAIHVGFIQGNNLNHYHKLFADYEALPSSRSLPEKTQDEFTFYCETLKVFAGIRLTDLQELSRKMWHGGITGFREKHGLIHYLYPEMAYLYALAVQGAKRKDQGLVAVTASPLFALEPALSALSLNPQRLCSMDLAIDSKGWVTAKIPRPVHGILKVKVAQALLPRWDYAVGDNPRNDLAFLQAAEKMALGVGKEIKILEGKMKKLTCLKLALPPVISARTPD